MKVTLETLGCKLNQAETESLAWQLAAAGYGVVPDVREADVYILNTCTVTATADAKARQRLRRAHRRNPEAFIVATGCLAEREPGRTSAMPGVGLIVSNRDKPALPSLLEERLDRKAAPCTGDISAASLRTRAFIKVQDGCNGACAYCIVPKVRGQETSVPPDAVLAGISHRLVHGIQEIVLTGTEVGSYRSGGYCLKDLLQRVLATTPVPRLRLSSLQPGEISSELLSLWADHRLCPHFHLSIQSGSDAILQRMRRRYSVAQYVETVSRIRALIPGAAITTDVIVGFPGETDALFEESLRTCRDLEFARIHVFSYSPRPGTEAATLLGRVDEPTKRRRAAMMLSLAEESARNFKAAFRGKARPVLWEHRDSNGLWRGLTDNYIPVTSQVPEDLENRITPFTVE